jgi:AraC-like DNA-binding protein
VLVTAGHVRLGDFDASPDAPGFATAAPIRYHCIGFPRRGVWIAHDGSPPFVADPTRITMYNPRQPYERRALDPAGDRSDWITVSESVAREVVALHDPEAAESERALRFSHAASDASLCLRQRRLHHYARRQADPDVLFVEEAGIDLFAGAIQGCYRLPGRGAGPVSRAHAEIVEAACAHLNRTFRANESLSTIAAAVGTSVFHLCRIFRRGTGLSLHRYRHQLRLRHALEPLERRDADLLMLALDLGYSGHSHFTTAFRRQFGAVPSHVRDRWLTAGS